MPSNKRIVHLLPAGIAGLGATLAIVVAMVGTAAASVAVDTGTQDFRGARDLGLAPRPAVATSVDTGSQDYRGARDLQSAAGLGATSTISAPKMTEALQPGQTVSTAISNTGGYNAEGQWVPGVDETVAPTGGYNAEGQWVPGVDETVAPSIIAPPEADGAKLGQARIDPAHEHLTPGTGSDPVYGATPSTSVLGPTSAPQPGQTGW
jgi:hypothetical protein